ncbi:MAG TPA: serine/threonine-protein kinase, partial [Kofleriaceae bacterium]|nr:serine/threonine-protein kinase [Kofleriaceae bacterium]
MIGVAVGQYECRRLLGQGGTGAVYLAVHRVLHTPRAVKVLLPEWTRYPEVVERFINEARAAAAIRHRNIIGVHDCGRLPSGEWYILLDYCEGGTLARYISSHGGPVAPHNIAHILAEVANGLGAAHHHGIIHRDLKPDNIHLANRDGDPHHVTILDFGVAKLGEPPLASRGACARSAGVHVTAATPTGEPSWASLAGAASDSLPGALVGTPAYMAPEQLLGERVGPAADVFALGVIAYQMLTGGFFPYQQEPSVRDYLRLTPVELYRRITKDGPVDPARRLGDAQRAQAPHVAAWTAAIRGALEPDPQRRTPSPRALALQLATATPGDGFVPGGLTAVRAYARELLEAGQEDATVRTAVPAPAASPERASRYRIGRRIGAGGMAEVFEGSIRGVEGFARPIAIKRVLPELSREDAFSAAFVEEARITSGLDHPNLVSVFDFDRDSEGRLFLVMEYVPGADLATLLRTGALPRSAAIFIVSEVLRGLAYAHALPSSGDRQGLGGLIHRDVSPHNVLLSREGAVKISDFGIARPLQGRTSVQVSSLSGKPAYMSPEQVRMDPLDVRSDLFSAGIILWEALTGERPFAGTTKEILAQVSFKEIAAHGEVHPPLPADLDAVVRKLLARDPARRFSSAAEAVDALVACADMPRDGRGELSLLMAERLGPHPATGELPRGAARTKEPTPLPTAGERTATPASQ